MKGSALHTFWWLWIPVLALAAQVALEILLPKDLLSRLHSEEGPHETLESLILAGAFLVSLRILRLPQTRRSAALTAWAALAALCCFYVAGEEISWGQHFLHWATPEFWSGLNDQNETNLHNTSSWLDQKPRILLQLGVLTGGIIVPLLRRFAPPRLPERFAVFYPPSLLAVPALGALIVNIADRIDSALPGTVLFVRASEVEELYMFYFTLLYLIDLRRRVAQDQG